LNPEDVATEHVTVRIATSLISAEQALENLRQEVSQKMSFGELLAEAKESWRGVLSRVDIKEIDAHYPIDERQKMLQIFYSNLYRASLFPRQLSETNSAGEVVHWSPYDGEGGVYPGALTSDSGFWDAYITVYPYLTLIHPQQLGTTIQGWLNAYQEGEWLPKWASPGYRGSMVGSMGDVSLADAIVKNVSGFDRELAYEAIRKDAFDAPSGDLRGKGRECLPPYLAHGYIPRDAPSTEGGECAEVVSHSLNYMQADFAIAQAALALGHEDDAAVLMARAMNYSLMFDGSTADQWQGGGFMRSKELLTGKWTERFDEFAWGGDYTEAGPWQFRFYVPFDPKGLAELYAARGMDMCDTLEQMQTMSGVFHLGNYGTEIHEQLEMTENCWGQYAHGNQPVHHVLYMFNGADADGVRGSCASRGQYWLRKTQRELYKYSPQMYAGDEDNGEMAAWYVLSTLGLFSLSPGSPQYLFGTPLFSEAEVMVGGTDDLVLRIVAKNNSPDNVYIQKVTWNGEDISSQNGIDYSLLVQGGELEFEMGSAPYSKKH
jgi:predicted alpha-1,2-mannosidase